MKREVVEVGIGTMADVECSGVPMSRFPFDTSQGTLWWFSPFAARHESPPFPHCDIWICLQLPRIRVIWPFFREKDSVPVPWENKEFHPGSKSFTTWVSQSPRGFDLHHDGETRNHHRH